MLVIGVAGTELTAQERDWLQHDACAGVILFKRNFASKAQVAELSQAIREAAPRPQLQCVDQEGGRVQRFRDGYSALPPLEGFGRLHARDRDAALKLAEEHAWLMASEVRGMLPSPLSLGQSLLLVWPQVTSLIAATCILFALSYVRFMRQEIRA